MALGRIERRWRARASGGGAWRGSRGGRGGSREARRKRWGWLAGQCVGHSSSIPLSHTGQHECLRCCALEELTLNDTDDPVAIDPSRASRSADAHPPSTLSPLALPLALASIFWSFWDPTWDKARLARVRGRRLDVHGRPTFLVSLARCTNGRPACLVRFVTDVDCLVPVTGSAMDFVPSEARPSWTRELVDSARHNMAQVGRLRELGGAAGGSSLA